MEYQKKLRTHILEIENDNLVRTIRTSTENFPYSIEEGSHGNFYVGHKRSLNEFILKFVRKINKVLVFFGKGDWKDEEIEKLLETIQSVDEVC